MDRTPEWTDSDLDEFAEHDETAAKKLAAERIAEGRDPDTGVFLDESKGVLHDGTADPYKVAAQMAGLPADALDEWRDRPLEALQDQIAKDEAERMHKRVTE